MSVAFPKPQGVERITDLEDTIQQACQAANLLYVGRDPAVQASIVIRWEEASGIDYINGPQIQPQIILREFPAAESKAETTPEMAFTTNLLLVTAEIVYTSESSKNVPVWTRLLKLVAENAYLRLVRRAAREQLKERIRMLNGSSSDVPSTRTSKPVFFVTDSALMPTPEEQERAGIVVVGNRSELSSVDTSLYTLIHVNPGSLELLGPGEFAIRSNGARDLNQWKEAVNGLKRVVRKQLDEKVDTDAEALKTLDKQSRAMDLEYLKKQVVPSS